MAGTDWHATYDVHILFAKCCSVKDGEFRVYKNSREENAIISFVDDKEWKKTDPVPWWKSPTSLQLVHIFSAKYYSNCKSVTM